MVDIDIEDAVSENDGESATMNENGKRSADAPNTDSKKRVKTKSLYRQPTVNELNRLQETENLFNSNLFRLQVEEILQEVKVKEKTEKKFTQWFAEFKSHLLSIAEDDTEYDLSENTLSKKLKVKLPIYKKLKATKCIFKFHKFKDVEVVGSYALGCSINSKLCIDVLITVPAETYTKNDSINYRYHKKRATYLAWIVSYLNKLPSIGELTYTWVNGCVTKAVIDVKPTGKLANYFTVRIDLACEAEAYKPHRFSPSRNNLRESWLFSEDTFENTDIGPSTPYYNNGVLKDLTASANWEYLKAILSNSDNLKQAIVLLNIWLRQRKLQVSGHVVSLFVAHLVQTKRINNIMSSYQIVRNVWISLKTSEWDTKGISLHKGSSSPSIDEFLQRFPVVFLDTTGYYNVTGDMCKGTYNALKRESALAVDMLDNGNINSFTSLFMVPVDQMMQFDHVLRFKNLPELKASIISKAPKESRVNYGLDHLSLVTDTLYALLAKGLGDRVDLILQTVDADFSWSVKKSPEKVRSKGYEEKLSFGFVLNPENSLNIVEKGPSANLPEAEEFRAFWGDKSELRRFQDGSITEACVWEADSLGERRAISRQILDYLIQLKYDVPPSDLFHVCNQLDSLTTSKIHLSQCEESSVEVLRAFDELRRDMRTLTELPLDVSAMYGVSPVFSYCCPLPPTPRAAPRAPWRRGAACLVKHVATSDGGLVVPEYTPVSRAVIELGHSGKWPGNLEAFRCLKAAFNLQIADRLMKQHSLPTQAYPSHVDVIKNGLVFRLEIAHPKELILLRREMENGVVRHRESEESVRLQCETVLMPRLRGALHGLHQKHPSFGPTVCLMKRWLSSHLLSPPHFPPTVSELLTASVFLHPEPLVASTQPTMGFLRVLRKLVQTEWSSEVVILDFNADMKREEIAEIERKFSSREPDCHAMCIVTSHDGSAPGAWCARAPSRPVLARAQSLARSALIYFEEALMRDTKDNVLAAFVPSLSGYDAVIHLHSRLVPHAAERLERRPEARPAPAAVCEDVIPVVEFHPVFRYLDELRSGYSDYALFFHDTYGGDVIAVLWKPDVAEPKEFQLSNANALKPIKSKSNSDTQFTINTAALIEDFRILGAGLVRDITVT